MSHVRLFPFENPCQLSHAIPRPDGAKTESGLVPNAVFLNFVIVADIFDHFVSNGTKQLGLVAEHFIFAARHLIPVVSVENFHFESTSEGRGLPVNKSSSSSLARSPEGLRKMRGRTQTPASK